MGIPSSFKLAALLRCRTVKSGKFRAISIWTKSSATIWFPARNDFDQAKVESDAAGYQLSSEYQDVDVAAIRELI